MYDRVGFDFGAVRVVGSNQVLAVGVEARIEGSTESERFLELNEMITDIYNSIFEGIRRISEFTIAYRIFITQIHLIGQYLFGKCCRI